MDEVLKVIRDKGWHLYAFAGMNNAVEVMYYRQHTPDIERAVLLYDKYAKSTEWGNNIYQGLTEDEHRFLGKMFGFTQEDIDWFVSDVKLNS